MLIADVDCTAGGKSKCEAGRIVEAQTLIKYWLGREKKMETIIFLGLIYMVDCTENIQ